MKPYQPSGKVPASGYLKMSLAAIAGGSFIGGLTHLISQLFYLIILFPIGIGVLGGCFIAVSINSGKVRNPLVAGMFALVTGFSIYGSTNYLDYVRFRHDTIAEIKKDVEFKTANPDDEIDNFLKNETNNDGFIGFVKYRAKQGVSIGRIGRSENNIGEVATWIYWLVELSIIQLILVLIAKEVAKQPFCESCDAWYKEEEPIGTVTEALANQFLDLLNNDRFAEAGQLIDYDIIVTEASHSLIVKKQISPADSNGDIFIKIGEIQIDEDGKSNTKEILSGMISPTDYLDFKHE
jgi:hypothetical protein